MTCLSSSLSKSILKRCSLACMAPHKKKESDKPSKKVRDRWERLKLVLHTDAARQVGTAFFGVALGVVLKQASESAVAEYRYRLAQAWPLIVQETKRCAMPRAQGR